MNAQDALFLLCLPLKSLDQISKLSETRAALRLSALKAEAKQNFRKLALEYHPDRTAGHPAKAQLFCQMTAAYRFIQDLELSKVLPPKGERHSIKTKLGHITFEIAPKAL